MQSRADQVAARKRFVHISLIVCVFIPLLLWLQPLNDTYFTHGVTTQATVLQNGVGFVFQSPTIVEFKDTHGVTQQEDLLDSISFYYGNTPVHIIGIRYIADHPNQVELEADYERYWDGFLSLYIFLQGAIILICLITLGRAIHLNLIHRRT